MQSKNRQFARACGLIACAGALLAAVPACADAPSTIRAKAKNVTLTECPPASPVVAAVKPHKDCASTQLEAPLETVATFKDSNLAASSADYIVLVSWGDATGLFPAEVRGGHGKFTVLARHAYGAPGTYASYINVYSDLGTPSVDVFGRIKVKFKH